MNLRNVTVTERSKLTEDRRVYDPIRVKCLEQADT